jgi:hypothetical protein
MAHVWFEGDRDEVATHLGSRLGTSPKQSGGTGVPNSLSFPLPRGELIVGAWQARGVPAVDVRLVNHQEPSVDEAIAVLQDFPWVSANARRVSSSDPR